MKVAVVGATGLVGSVMVRLLEERNFPVSKLLAVASERSSGKTIHFRDNDIKVCSPAEAIDESPDLALFSAGSTASLEWAPRFASNGTTVIDNSSAWRMDSTIKLIVPEVNAIVLSRADKIIANPNCSTIQLVMVLKPLHDKYRVKRVVLSTYQSVSGTGIKALDQLYAERGQQMANRVYPHPIDLNVIPHIDVFQDNGYTREEMKMVQETCKIIGDDSIRVTATAVRVPVKGGHSESVNIEFENEYELQELKSVIAAMPGVIVNDNPPGLQYPMPLYAEGKDEVFVGRIRRDETQPRTVNLWIVADNLRKGAATNAIQIAEYLMTKKLI